MEYCSLYARDCLSKCCDRFGDCPEYSSNPCYYFYAVQNSSRWSSESVFTWIVYVLVGIVSVIAFWFCCCRNTNQEGIQGQSIIPADGNVMTSAGPVTGIIANNKIQANPLAGSKMMNTPSGMAIPSTQANTTAEPNMMNTPGTTGNASALSQPQLMPLGVGGASGNPSATSGLIQNTASVTRQQSASQYQQKQPQQLTPMQSHMNETSGYGLEIDSMTAPQAVTSNKRMRQATSNVTQSPHSQGPRLI